LSRIIYDHQDVERFTVGTVGLPGERAFFIQASSPIGLNTIAIEKSQVAALAERLKELVKDLRRGELASFDELGIAATVDTSPLDFPIEEDFQAGVIGFTWESSTQRVTIEIQAITEISEQELLSADTDISEIDDPPDLLRASLRIFQVRGFCERALSLVAAGRQPCPFCGLPIDPEGHLCPRANGYRR
jgi:uncharacterized repeat protein (TIGR03847 family)